MLYAFAAVSDRYVTTRFPTLLYSYLIYLIMFFLIGIYLIFFDSKKIKVLRKSIKSFKYSFAMIAIAAMVATIFRFTSYSLQKVTFVLPVLSLEAIISVFAGGYFFKEEKIIVRIIGTVLIILGIIFVIF